MKIILQCAFIFFIQFAMAQVNLDANGPGDTYELITSVLAPDENPIEVPDCDHEAFGRHIDEVFDADLNAHVFRFLLHVTPDNDRCIIFDRQRNEIKSYSPSPDNLLGVEGEIVIYKWKFKLPEGFQVSPNFTHLHQLKSVGGPYASHPMYTLTARKGTPDRMEIRYGEVDGSSIMAQSPLEPFINTWVEATEIITYGVNGTYEITLNRLSDNEELLSFESDNIINWREDADFVRPKWGIYRSLNNAQDLRDEEVFYANFSVEEVESLSIDETNSISEIQVYVNDRTQILSIEGIPAVIDTLILYSLDGKKVLERSLKGENSLSLETSSFSSGAYILSLTGSQQTFRKKILVR